MLPTGLARRVYPLFCGFEIVDISVSLRGHTGRTIAAPIGAFLVEHANGVMLVDAGANEEIVWDPERCPEYYRAFRQPVIREAETLLHQIALTPFRPSDVTHVIVSHLHADHGGGIRLFPEARIVIQRAEYEYAMSVSSPDTGYFRSDWDLPTTQWDVIDGDVEVVPGVAALAAYGHTPGHQAAHIRLPNAGSIIIPGDSGDLLRNFDELIPPGGARDIDAAVATLSRLRDLRSATSGFIFPGHDLSAWQQFRRAPDFYD